MSDRKDKRRIISESDIAIWNEYCKSVKPLGGTKKIRTKDDEYITNNIVVESSYYSNYTPLLKNVNGAYEDKASIDLHGLTQQEAYEELMAFLEMATQNNFNSLLIITGKGSGALRNNLPRWLNASKYSGRIIHLKEVSPSNQGAFSLKLKRTRV